MMSHGAVANSSAIGYAINLLFTILIVIVSIIVFTIIIMILESLSKDVIFFFVDFVNRIEKLKSVEDPSCNSNYRGLS